MTSRIQGGQTKIELVFSFDTTGSMSKVLHEVRTKLKEMIRRLFADIPGIRIAIIAHGGKNLILEKLRNSQIIAMRRCLAM